MTQENNIALMLVSEGMVNRYGISYGHFFHISNIIGMTAVGGSFIMLDKIFYMLQWKWLQQLK
ncbi:hypothetical protein Ana3638_07840 [Anaerocolumna sedimenticola]|uniref:Uncharacterized protein n=1 Tax=Anaerocolumna sedimenticola TaxID=2696063 RepID=A0A6P1THS5_9FIRM|nr:hypothetical protein [Anaerocolumna sedimenticola]QHQ60694.1 hypothetical protein Ana3638_07840 [Anaerocolumna sedimenticola]